MKMIKNPVYTFLILILINVYTAKSQEKSSQQDAEAILQKAIRAHGGTRYNAAAYQFVFRGDTYTFKSKEGSYLYAVKKQEKGKEIYDVIENGVFKRTINNEEKALSKGAVTRHYEALNSVVYFATLPHKLNDASVNKTYKGSTTIKGKTYDALEISFSGDHGDIFHFWIDQKTGIIDYFAYKFTAGGGGTRFRSAYNPRTIDGIRFQDYINYKAASKVAFSELPALYEAGKLKKLSNIDTEQIVNLDK
ncbi:hypothetical protein GTQ40_07370 [Flavobacteriaceae bacterium R38]|nr:hypothetical protein [Flavobacteriaceae bacterium R38]